MNFAPATRRFAGTPGARFRDSCIYSVTDSSQPAATVSERVEIEVAGPVTGTLMLPASVVPENNVIRLRVGERARRTFQEATGGVEPYTYEFYCPDPPPGVFPLPSRLPPRFGIRSANSGSVRHPGDDLYRSRLHLLGNRQRHAFRHTGAKRQPRRAHHRSTRQRGMAVQDPHGR